MSAEGRSPGQMVWVSYGTPQGLLGPLVDVGNAQSPGAGYAVALTAAALASLGAAAVVRRTPQPAAP